MVRRFLAGRSDAALAAAGVLPRLGRARSRRGLAGPAGRPRIPTVSTML